MTRNERYFGTEGKVIDTTLINLSNCKREERRAELKKREEERIARLERTIERAKAHKRNRPTRKQQVIKYIAATPSRMHDAALLKYAEYATLPVEEREAQNVILAMCMMAAAVMWSIECC